MFRRLLPYAVLVSLTLVLGHIFQPLQHLGALAQSQANCQTFKETGKRVCGKFRQYWQSNGGLIMHGLPLSNEFVEVSEMDGRPYIVQYFERTVFELHNENDPPYDILLSQLGTFRWWDKYGGKEPAGPVQVTRTPGTAQPPTSPTAVRTGTAVPPTPVARTPEPTEDPKPVPTKPKPKP